MTGAARAAPIIADCARCVHNSPLLVEVIHCEAKIALSNSLAVIAVFLLAWDRGICEAFIVDSCVHAPMRALHKSPRST